MGLVFNSISTSGIGALAIRITFILLLVGGGVYLVVNPFLIAASHQHPLVFKCLRASGIFTRSSAAANIPL